MLPRQAYRAACREMIKRFAQAKACIAGFVASHVSVRAEGLTPRHETYLNTLRTGLRMFISQLYA